jgi:hypothetical protein
MTFLMEPSGLIRIYYSSIILHLGIVNLYCDLSFNLLFDISVEEHFSFRAL